MRTVNDTIMIADSKGVSVIDISAIIRIEAVNNYSKLFLNDGRHLMVSKVLKTMQALLADKGFERIHRSHLVNAACIKRYNLYQKKVTLFNSEELSISRRKKTDLRKKLLEKRLAFLNQQKSLVAA